MSSRCDESSGAVEAEATDNGPARRGLKNGLASPSDCAAKAPHAGTTAGRMRHAATSVFHILSAVLGAMGHAVLAFDCAGCLVSHNEHAASLFDIVSSGRTIHDLLARKLVHDPQANGAGAAAIESALKGERVERLKVSIAGPNSTRGRFALTTHPLREANGTEVGTVAIFERIGGAEARDEAALLKARDAGLEASRLRSEFAASMSHELRTPLNAIIGMTEMLLDSELADEQREYARTIAASAQALLRIVEDVLDFSRISAGELKLEQSEFVPAEVIKDVVEAYAQAAAAKGIELSAELDRSVPDGPLIGDAERLTQVLINLVDNALKFTARGRVLIRVAEETHTAEQSVLHFVVSDTGIGIPPEAQRTLFQIFSKGDTSMSRSHGGAGVGLPLAAKIVAAMGGTIGVESVPDKGSSFWFTAALRKPGAASVAASKPSRRLSRIARVADSASTPGDLPVQSTVRILVAEDNPVNQKVMLTMLRKLGYSAEVAVNGLEAITAVTQRPYDIVLMDCQMPELDGYEATRRIRRQGGRFARIPIVGVTAHALSGDREKCLAAGMDEYLSKPIMIQGLAEALNRWVGPARSALSTTPAAEDHGHPAAPAPSSPQTGPALSANEKAAEPIDQGALEQLEEVQKDGAGEGFVANLINLFLADMEQRAQAMGEALRNSNWDVAGRMAHAIKGSCGHFGAKRLAELCARMEGLARGQERAQAPGLFAQLQAECQRVKSALKAHRLARDT